MWTIILLDYNGHREEKQLPSLQPTIRAPILGPPAAPFSEKHTTKEYRLSCRDEKNRKAIYVEVL